jgi:hypothetical protein
MTMRLKQNRLAPLFALALVACVAPATAIERPRPVVSALPAPAPAFTGRVVDAAGQPVADAVITATTEIDWVGEEPTSQFAVSDARGEFRMEGLPSGSYRLNATTSTGWASSAAAVLHKAGQQTSSDALVLRAEGFVGRGVVRDAQGQPLPMAKVEALPLLPTDAAPGFGAVSDARGEFSMRLPAGDAYLLIATAPGRKRAYGRLDSTVTTADLDLSAKPVSMPDEKALSQWLASDALPIASDDPEASLEDLAPLTSWIGDASIVGLGEARSSFA